MLTAKTIYFSVQNRWDNFREILISAGKFNGILYGKFVYETLVPSLKSLNEYLNCNGIINLWFRNEEDKKGFLELFTRFDNYHNMYRIFRGGIYVCTFDITVSPYFPSQTFNIEQLAAIVQAEGIYFHSYGFESAHDLIQLIYKKNAKILLLHNIKSKLQELCLNGWEISYTISINLSNIDIFLQNNI